MGTGVKRVIFSKGKCHLLYFFSLGSAWWLCTKANKDQRRPKSKRQMSRVVSMIQELLPRTHTEPPLGAAASGGGRACVLTEPMERSPYASLG